ncbi:MAG: site-specific DNA-methyltransferase [Alphaproteobacteria bacterium]|nr:site-specific DNA-methyltransferase [Alphaproteobacteria bacterium]
MTVSHTEEPPSANAPLLDRVCYRDLEALTPNPRNARRHPASQIRKLARSLERFGFLNPVMVDDDGMILAGHGRVEAARRLGWTMVPTLTVTHLSAQEQRAYALAENRLAELAEWDTETLGLELSALLEVDPAFDVGAVGFEDAEVDVLTIVASMKTAEPPPPEPNTSTPPVSRLGDLWCLGPHRLVCGDALDGAVHSQLMAGEPAAMVFTDPPYNVPINGHVTTRRDRSRREFAMASGEMSQEAFRSFLHTALGHAVTSSTAGAVHMVCMDWRHLVDLLAVGEGLYREFLNLCVWDKGVGGMGSLYRSRHELVLVFRSGTTRHRNNVQLGRFGRNRSNVWGYPGVANITGETRRDAGHHPTIKPVALVADAVLDVTKANEVVLDPFGGAGTTLIAAERTQRRARLVEIDPLYVDTTIERWQRETGCQAILEATGQSFADRRRECTGLPRRRSKASRR